MSEATYVLARDCHEFTERGMIDIKGKGMMAAYLLRGPGGRGDL